MVKEATPRPVAKLWTPEFWRSEEKEREESVGVGGGAVWLNLWTINICHKADPTVQRGDHDINRSSLIDRVLSCPPQLSETI